MCGDEFCTHNHTMLEAMVIARFIVFYSGFYGASKRPEYIGAIYRRHLKGLGYENENAFVAYAHRKLSDSWKTRKQAE